MKTINFPLRLALAERRDARRSRAVRGTRRTHKRAVMAASIMAALLTAGWAAADEVAIAGNDNPPTNPPSIWPGAWIAIDPGVGLAFKFTVIGGGPYRVTRLAVAPFSDTVTDADFFIHSDNGGLIGPQIAVFHASGISTSRQVVTATPYADVMLSSGTPYWIMASGTVGTIVWSLGFHTLGPGASHTNGGDWEYWNSDLCAFTLMGTTNMYADPALSGSEAKLTASDGAGFDLFGAAVAADGDVAVVGAYWDDDAGEKSGSAYVYERNAGGIGTWRQVQKLTASDASVGDTFGQAVAVDGDVAVVGAPEDDDAGNSSGSAYVFERNAGGTNAWSQVIKLTASDAGEAHFFGRSVAVAGDVIVVGAWGWDSYSGAAYVFERNAGGTNAWGQVAKLVAEDITLDARFGCAVGVDGDVAVIGAYQDDDQGYAAGAMYVFERNVGGTNAWGQVQKIIAWDGVPNQYFGYAVAVAGDVAVAGAYGDDTAGGEAGAAYVFERNIGGTNAWGQVRKLTASDAGAGDQFGISLAVDGDVIVAGANQDDTSAADTGSAYVFERHAGGTNTWGQTRKLLASDATTNDWLGWSVAVAGDFAVAGAPGDSGMTGAAYILPVSAETKEFFQTDKLTAADGTTNDWFSFSVAVAGDVAMVGVPHDSDAGNESGSAYVYERHAGGTNAWGQVQKLTAFDGEAFDDFGFSVAVAGDVAVVGAYGDSNVGHQAGSAYVYERNAGGTNVWGFVRKLGALDAAAGDIFGTAVAADGDVIVVGAKGDDDMGTASGSAYVFERNAGGTNAWGQVRKLTASDATAGDWFGGSVAVAGDVVLVGAPTKDAGPLINAGAAYLFERNAGGTNTWGEIAKLTPMVPGQFDSFGIAVAVDGDVAVIGAYGDSHAGTASGSAYVFERNAGGTNAWGRVRKLTASDAAAYHSFGVSVAVSGDATVIGAYGDGDAGYYAGAAYVFERNAGGTNAWGQTQKLIAADTAAGDILGFSVALAGDVVVVGAKGDDDAGDESGSAYIFEELFPGPEAPVIERVEKASAGIRLAWPSAVPVDYTVQFRDQMQDGLAWSNLPGAVDLPGTDTLLWATNAPGALRRFYRVQAADSPLR